MIGCNGVVVELVAGEMMVIGRRSSHCGIVGTADGLVTLEIMAIMAKV